jgi:hypothetical protein
MSQDRAQCHSLVEAVLNLRYRNAKFGDPAFRIQNYKS